MVEGHPGLSCGSELGRCDIHETACRQDILDAVACLRDYDEQVTQPRVHFISLTELGEPPPGEGDFGGRNLRLAYSLFGLVSPNEVEDAAAQAAQLDDIGAIYSAEEKAIYVVEDPRAKPSDAEGVAAFETGAMNILAHEFVHFLQDREFDLEEYAENFPEDFDPLLAQISAVEGEAMLCEAQFAFEQAGVAATDERIVSQFESYVGFAETAIRDAASPVLEARMLFPYTYGGHSNAVLHRDEGKDGVAELRDTRTSLSFVQRRWGIVSREPEPIETEELDIAGLGFEELGEQQFGAWLVSVFLSRTLDMPTADALALGQQWRGDVIHSWRDPDTDEVIGNWILDFDSEDVSRQRIAELGSALLRSPPRDDSAWTVRVEGKRIEITSSTIFDSAVVQEIHSARAPDSGTRDAEVADASAPDAPKADPLPVRRPTETVSASGDAGLVGEEMEVAMASKRLADLQPSDVDDRSSEAGILVRRLRAHERLRQRLTKRQPRVW